MIKKTKHRKKLLLLLLILLWSSVEPRWWGSDLLFSPGPVSDHPEMNGSRDRVVLFQVDFWEDVVGVDRLIGNISN